MPALRALTVRLGPARGEKDAVDGRRFLPWPLCSSKAELASLCTASPPDSPDLPQRQVTACGRAGRRWRSWAWRERPCQTQHGGWCRRRCREAAACSFESAASRARGEGGAGGSGVWRAAVVLPLQAPPAWQRRLPWPSSCMDGGRHWRRRPTTVAAVMSADDNRGFWHSRSCGDLGQNCKHLVSLSGPYKRRRRLAPEATCAGPRSAAPPWKPPLLEEAG